MAEPIYRLPPWSIEQVLLASDLEGLLDWGLTAYGIPGLWKETEGEGVTIAVLDTGAPDHPDLAGAVQEARDFASGFNDPMDHQGHSTHCCGTIGARGRLRGLAPKCNLLIGKVLGDDGSGSDVGVSNGIDWAVSAGANIISMSLGGPQPSNRQRQAIAKAVAAGVFVIVAAGNSGPGQPPDYPGAFPESLAVGAVDEQGRVAPFSSRGDYVTIAAPGVNVLSTFLLNRGGYAKLSGTSMATPFVAGCVALALAKHKNQNWEVKDNASLKRLLQLTAKDTGPTGRDPDTGWGLIQPGKMLSAGGGTVPPPLVRTPLLDFAGVRVYAPGMAGDDLGLKFGSTKAKEAFLQSVGVA